MAQTHSLQIFRVMPFAKLQNNTYTTVKQLKTKNEMRKERTYLCLDLVSECWQPFLFQILILQGMQFRFSQNLSND